MYAVYVFTMQSGLTAADRSLLTCNGCHGDPNSTTFTSQDDSHFATANSYRSRSESSSSDDSSSTSGDSLTSEEAILKEAGVTFNLSSVTSEDGHAPLELVSQCVTCLMNDQYEAASLLCQKVLEFEPENTTAQEIHQVLEERLELDEELETESSSDASSGSSESESGSSSSSEEDGAVSRESNPAGKSHHCTA